MPCRYQLRQPGFALLGQPFEVEKTLLHSKKKKNRKRINNGKTCTFVDVVLRPRNAPDCTDFNVDFHVFRGACLRTPLLDVKNVHFLLSLETPPERARLHRF